jgi:hypothetical protein
MGGDTVSISNTYFFGSDVNQATLRSWGEKVKADTLATVLDARKRGGKMKQAFAR